MRKPVKAAPKHHPVKPPHVVVKEPEKAEKPVHIAVKEPEKSDNKELIDGLKRAKQQIWQHHFRHDEAVQATKWIDELIARTE